MSGSDLSLQQRLVWQRRVDEALFWLQVADFRRMGVLSSHGPKVDPESCERVLKEGELRGVHPTPQQEDGE